MDLRFLTAAAALRSYGDRAALFRASAKATGKRMRTITLDFFLQLTPKKECFSAAPSFLRLFKHLTNIFFYNQARPDSWRVANRAANEGIIFMDSAPGGESQ